MSLTREDDQHDNSLLRLREIAKDTNNEPPMTLTFVVLALTVLLFASEKMRPDLVALLSMLALFLAGTIDTGEALGGFADNTVILVAVLFGAGEGMSRSGVGTWLGHQMVRRSGGSQDRLLVLIMVGTAVFRRSSAIWPRHC